MSSRFGGTLLLALCAGGYCQVNQPSWLTDPAAFCTELTHRANSKASEVPLGVPKATRFEDYAVHPVAPQRATEALIGKYDWTDKASFGREVKVEAAKGPDFAGRYAIVEWSCGSWCTNSVIADVVSGKMYDPPFVGVVGCSAITGDQPTLQRRADSSLLIVRGMLEMSFDHYLSEGPCGSFYFRWNGSHLRLIGCDIPKDGQTLR